MVSLLGWRKIFVDSQISLVVFITSERSFFYLSTIANNNKKIANANITIGIEEPE